MGNNRIGTVTTLCFELPANAARAGIKQRPCPYCGKYHDLVCGRISAITWDVMSSLIVKVELHEPEKTKDIFP